MIRGFYFYDYGALWWFATPIFGGGTPDWSHPIQGATDVDFWIEYSSDLETWHPLEEAQIEAQHVEGSTEHVTIRTARPLQQEQRGFLRLRVERMVE